MTTADFFDSGAEASELLQLRYKARAWLWGKSTLQRVRHCGRVAQSVAVPILSFPGGHVQGAGLQHCSSVWACPVCSAGILATRAQRLTKVIDGWRAKGGQIAMITLTMSHDRNDDLGQLWDDVQSTWTAMWQGTSWRRLQDKFGTLVDAPRELSGRSGWAAQRAHDESGNERLVHVVEELTDVELKQRGFKRRIPMIRTVELTWGPAGGWHVHVHALMLLRGDVDTESALSEIWLGDEETGAKGILRKWQDRVQKLGRYASTSAQDAHVVRGQAAETVGKYLSKAVLDGSKIVGELARGDLKIARGANMTPWQMLAVLASGQHPEKERQLLKLWRDYEQVSRGRRQMIIPRGVAEYVGLDEVQGRDDDDYQASEGRFDDWSPAELLEGSNAESPISNNLQPPQYWRPAGPPAIVGVVSGRVWREEICRFDRHDELRQAVHEGRLGGMLHGLGLQVEEVRGSSLGLVDWVGPNTGVVSA